MTPSPPGKKTMLAALALVALLGAADSLCADLVGPSDVPSAVPAKPRMNGRQGLEGLVFPVKGRRQDFTGKTRHTAPRRTAQYLIAEESAWFVEWPTPKPAFLYGQFKGQRRVGNNQEPGFYACRPTPSLPDGCGRPHRGIDIYAHYGTPIVAPEDGEIIAYAGSGVYTPAGRESKNGGAGRLIRLRGRSGSIYTFMHTMGVSGFVAEAAGIPRDFGNSAEKPLNVPVKAGDIIAYVGTTGGIVNPHLHFHVSKDGADADLGEWPP